MARRSPQHAGVLPLGSRAPDFSATTTTGAHISLSSLRGHAVLLNFWFTNCPPCRTEMPALQRAYDDLGRHGVVILGVDAIGEDAASITAFANPLGITYPLLLDPDQHVTRELYRVDSTPQSFFIDPRGVIRAEHTGPLTAAELQDGLSKLQAL
jgi:cytochrome c biogenesis protein CcmG/thiol:disulfide interchange protein DsbE